MSIDPNTASESKMRDYIAKVREQHAAIKDAQTLESKTKSSRLEAKHKMDDKEKELWEVIDESDSFGADQCEAIKTARADHQKAQKEFSLKDSKHSEAKESVKTKTKILIEIIDEKNDPQERMDFDKMGDSGDAPASPEGGEPRSEVDNFRDWRDVPASQLKVSKSISDLLKQERLRTVGLVHDRATNASGEDMDGLLSIEGFTARKNAKVLEAIEVVQKKYGVEDMVLEEV